MSQRLAALVLVLLPFSPYGVACSKFKAHDKVCIGVEWNPYHPSGVATCGWDGLIKYWM